MAVVLDHKHLLVNAVVRKPPGAGDEGLVADWLVRLVAAVNMKVVIPPRVHYCTAQDNEGLTAAVNIETSHCAVHVWDKLSPALFNLDLYSCATFDKAVVLDLLGEFDPERIDWLLVDRNKRPFPADSGWVVSP